MVRRQVKFYPYKKGAGGGAEKVLAMLKGGGGHKRYWGSFNMGARSFSHTGRGGCNIFLTFKVCGGGGEG